MLLSMQALKEDLNLSLSNLRLSIMCKKISWQKSNNRKSVSPNKRQLDNPSKSQQDITQKVKHLLGKIVFSHQIQYVLFLKVTCPSLNGWVHLHIWANISNKENRLGRKVNESQIKGQTKQMRHHALKINKGDHC